MRENITNDVHTIVDTSIQNELVEKSQSELEAVEPVLGINHYAEKHKLQDIKENTENTKNNAQPIVKINIHEQAQSERSLLEYERILSIEDYPSLVSEKYVNILTQIARKTAYVLHWLDGVNKAKDTKNIKPSILEQLRGNPDQSVNTKCSKNIQLREHKPSDNNKFCMQNKRKENLGYYNEASNLTLII